MDLQISKDLAKKLDNPLLVLYLVVALVPFLYGLFDISAFYLSIFNFLIAGCCCYFAWKRKVFQRNILPILFVVSMGIFYYDLSVVGFQFWIYVFSVGLIGIALWESKIVDMEVGFLISIFLMSTVLHCIPAYITDYIEEIDPHYHYKWAEMIDETGTIPEYDWNTYPKTQGLDRSTMPFGTSVSIAFYGKLLNHFGMGFHQSALLISGLVAGLTVVVVYFLLKELFRGSENVKYIAMFGAVVLCFSVAWSMKAHATDCEDDAIGMFLLLSTALLYVLAINRDNIMISAVGGGLLFGWFSTVWDGQRMLTMVVAFFIVIYSIFGILKKFRTFIYMKHYLLIFIVGNILWRFVLKFPDQTFGVMMPQGIEIASLIIMVCAALVNEVYARWGFTLKRSRFYILLISLLVMLFVFQDYLYSIYEVGFLDVGRTSVVFKTIAEQSPFATDISSYVTKLVLMFGPASIIGLLSVPFMLYYGMVKRHYGSVLLASWLAPMAWGLYHKTQYAFVASVPFALASSWFVMFIISKRSHLESLRIIPTIVAVFIILTYSPFGSFFTAYNSSSIFYNVVGYDRMAWESALQYFRNDVPETTSVITWWDYGHWLTSVSKRFVIVDNLQRDHWQIQDVARFFMKETDEEKAFDIIREYQGYYSSEPYVSMFGGVNLDYVVIDWTMIPKSGALRFIATGNLTDQSDGEYVSYSMCSFSPQDSVIEDVMAVDDNGMFIQRKVLVFTCTYNTDGLGAVVVFVEGNNIRIDAVTMDGNRVPWDAWMASNGGVLFGVKSPIEIFGAVIQYADQIRRIPPTYTTLIYAPEGFKDLMMSRLYFGETVSMYRDLGLNDVGWNETKYFTKAKSFEEGFVVAWNIDHEGGVDGSD